jgi:hypothetical protein
MLVYVYMLEHLNVQFFNQSQVYVCNLETCLVCTYTGHLWSSRSLRDSIRLMHVTKYVRVFSLLYLDCRRFNKKTTFGTSAFEISPICTLGCYNNLTYCCHGRCVCFHFFSFWSGWVSQTYILLSFVLFALFGQFSPFLIFIHAVLLHGSKKKNLTYCLHVCTCFHIKQCELTPLVSWINSMYKTLERYRTCNYNSQEATPTTENEVSIQSS